MPTKKKKTKTESNQVFADKDILVDAECGKLEDDDGLETLRFVKMTQLSNPNITTAEAQSILNEYREQDALAFARTIKRLFTGNNQKFRDMILDNAEARLREYKNRPK